MAKLKTRRVCESCGWSIYLMSLFCNHSRCYVNPSCDIQSCLDDNDGISYKGKSCYFLWACF